jgi:hypothetical protein
MSFTPDELDAKWRQLADEKADDMIVSLEAKFQQAAEEFETRLSELRDFARMKLSEGRVMQPRQIWRHKDNDREIVITEIFDGEVKYEFLDSREPYELPIDEFPNWFEVVE